MNEEKPDTINERLIIHHNTSSESLDPSRRESYDFSNYTSANTENENDQYSDYRLSDVTVDIHPDESNFTFKKCIQFIGPGFLVSVGYLDPGNWATDIAGGSQFGYKLMWVLLMSNIMALCLQTLAARLGLVTERDLAQCCRYKYPRKVCTVLWVLTEIAIAATDLAEVLGTAIGLELLIGLPLIFGVLFTVCDTLIFLLVQKYGIRKLEALIFSLLSFITFCFIIELFLSKPKIGSVVMGLIPTIDSASLFIAMGMLGATVMPHNFYLHSSLVQSRKFGRSPAQIRQACFYNLIDSGMALNVAFFVNGSILVVAAAVFHAHGLTVTELEDAHGLLEGFVHSSIAPFMFGLGLFCAGQSSTLTGTMAGQIVMEGFLQMKMVPWLRRLITRCVAVVPAAIVIAIMGNAGTYKLLILSQVILSLQLPFAIVPLIKFTSDKKLMNEFVSPGWLVVVSWFFAAIIISLNMWMVFDNLYTMYTYSYGTRLIATFFFAPLSMMLLVLLGYLTLEGTFLLEPLERFIAPNLYSPLHHHTSAIDLTELTRKESTETVS